MKQDQKRWRYLEALYTRPAQFNITGEMQQRWRTEKPAATPQLVAILRDKGLIPNAVPPVQREAPRDGDGLAGERRGAQIGRELE
jgi:hypothetical protein